MVTLRYNKPSSLDVNYVGGKRGYMRILPGINLNVDDGEWQYMRHHPSIRMALDVGELDVLFVEPTTADKDGFELTLKDDSKTGQPMPAMDVDLTGRPFKPELKKPEPPKVETPIVKPIVAPKAAWKPDVDELSALSKIGKVSAQKILETMPESGFNSVEQFKELNPDAKYVLSEIEAKFS